MHKIQTEDGAIWKGADATFKHREKARVQKLNLEKKAWKEENVIKQ